MGTNVYRAPDNSVLHEACIEESEFEKSECEEMDPDEMRTFDAYEDTCDVCGKTLSPEEEPRELDGD